MNIIDCILKIYPDWKGLMFDNNYLKIKPHELETRPIPSLSELEAVWPIIEAERIAAEQAEAQRVVAKAQAIIDNLPSRVQVRTAINNIANLADAKAFLLKLADVVYWDVKNTQE